MSFNQLATETSPYLRQHRDQPVQWRAWNDEAFREAKAGDKPVLLSIGYAACHWCHVMARESFENTVIAELINELFIPIKVDREERPDLDAAYQRALVRLGGRGGWPLTLFLTPAGEPFAGGTYFPPVPRWGELSFPERLREAAGDYRNQRPQVAQRAANVARELALPEGTTDSTTVDERALDRFATLTARQIDPIHGGLSGTPKFPNSSVLELLWRGYLRTKNSAWKNAVVNSLTRMSQGGIYDHLGGGFARYSTDARWLVPHFEKMLYDNAQLIELLSWVWLDSRKELHARRVEETVQWVLREMARPGGGFSATLDAETNGDEGGFYLWTEGEIDHALGRDGNFFKQHYDVTSGGNWRGRNILNRLRSPGPLKPENENRLTAARSILAGLRSGRTPPRRDDKLLVDWNGLIIGALVVAAQTFGRPEWLEAARTAWSAVIAATLQPDGRLVHSLFQGKTHPGTLDDYAALCRAGLRLHEATRDDRYLAQVLKWVEVVETHFKDSDGPGYFLSDDEVRNPLGRLKTATDDATPPGNAVFVEVFARLYLITGNDRYRARAEEIVTGFSGLLAAGYLSATALLNSAEFLLRPVQITVIGDLSTPATGEMLTVVREFPSNRQLVSVVAPGASFPTGHPLFGKIQVGGRTTVYVCEGTTCSLPITEPEILRNKLAGTDVPISPA
jgi:uncharacterized protein YyaL (SSP411 family)